jgi:hypothetical protein
MSNVIEKFEDLVGEIVVYAIGEKGDDEIKLTLSDGRVYRLYHDQDCCESVTVEDIAGEWEDIYGWPLTVVEVVTHEGENPPGVPVKDYQDSFTWTFYRLGTSRGIVTIRWYGESNGYYSESVSFEEEKA